MNNKKTLTIYKTKSMPIESFLLKEELFPYSICPNCNNQFDQLMRGQVHRRKRDFLFRKRPYCAVICRRCRNIVGWEYPPPNYPEIILLEIKKELKKKSIKSNWNKYYSPTDTVCPLLTIQINKPWYCIDRKPRGDKIDICYDSSSVTVEITTHDLKFVKLLPIEPEYLSFGREVYSFSIINDGFPNNVVEFIMKIFALYRSIK